MISHFFFKKKHCVPTHFFILTEISNYLHKKSHNEATASFRKDKKKRERTPGGVAFPTKS